MSLEDDDYLSDKFLTETATTVSEPKTYAQRRREVEKLSRLRNEENKKKSNRQLEREARAEGLNRSLFEVQDTGSSKALSMMMKMGFMPGQSLGRPLEDGPSDEQPSQDAPTLSQPTHKTEPLPINEWQGKKGIGSLKRAPSPDTAERLAKMAKMAEASTHQDFRDRAKEEYEERRAEGRLGPAQLTCRTLDEKGGKEFSVLWLNPTKPETFPPDFLDALESHSIDLGIRTKETEPSMRDRLRRQMQKDRLLPLEEGDNSLLGASRNASTSEPQGISSESIEEAIQFLRLQAQDRLQLVLSYLRDRHAYCFWCGVHYENAEEMESQCPGRTEEEHD
ncbi:hypothetical protein AX15_006373 [Amanita polypyramis BW_CC]|nr:hypothetical protein AX15_006373 [Amanita polypyramis BW_CC]